MRTTLALDDELLAKAQAFSGGTAFGMGFLFRMKAARHSSASNSMSAGRSGRVRPRRIRRLIRQAITM
ncbi:MAG: type II toxin-antitoxin system VapB family antitoxin [Zoogloea sp.]|nr:type II toxin-antitoxin system VapB family antitoxin [Zoogloea sp.]